MKKTTKKDCGKSGMNDCMENCSDNVKKKGSTSSPKNCGKTNANTRSKTEL